MVNVSVFQVRRNNILEDSYRQIHSIPSNKVDTLKTKLWIEFDGNLSQRASVGRETDTEYFPQARVVQRLF